MILSIKKLFNSFIKKEDVSNYRYIFSAFYLAISADKNNINYGADLIQPLLFLDFIRIFVMSNFIMKLTK